MIFVSLGCDTYAEPSSHERLVRISPGTQITGNAVKGWSEVVMIAQPAVVSGDVEKLPEVIKDYAELFATVILADFQREEESVSLRRVGIGLAVASDSGFRIVSSQTAKADHLGMIATKVLSGAEESLNSIRICGLLTQAIVIDSPAIVAQDDVHKALSVRHMIWVDQQAKLHSLVWLVQPGAQATVVDDAAIRMSANHRSTRRLHVLGSEFFLGIPSSKAFAMEGLPRGQRIPFDETMGKELCKAMIPDGALRALIRYASDTATK